MTTCCNCSSGDVMLRPTAIHTSGEVSDAGFSKLSRSKSLLDLRSCSHEKIHRHLFRLSSYFKNFKYFLRPSVARRLQSLNRKYPAVDQPLASKRKKNHIEEIHLLSRPKEQHYHTNNISKTNKNGKKE